MRPQGKTKLGFFPLPLAEVIRLRNCLTFSSEFSAVDPCVGDGVAFSRLLEKAPARRYGIEIDANRAEQARELGIETLQANTLDVRCPPSRSQFSTSILRTIWRWGRRIISDWSWCFWSIPTDG